MIIEPGPAEPSRQDRRRATTRARLIAAARGVLSEKGPDATTIAEIAQAADLGFGTFYNYFDSKEAVLDAVIADALAAFRDELEAAIGPQRDQAEMLAMALRYMVDAVQRDPVWGWFLVRIWLSRERLGAGLRAMLERGLCRGVAMGRFVASGERTAPYIIGGAVITVLNGRLDGSLGPEAGVDLAEFSLRALGVPADEAARIARLPVPKAGAVRSQQQQR